MDLSRPNSKLSNMNIFTFIKEIYSSLKYLIDRTTKTEDLLKSKFNTIDERISILQNENIELNTKLDLLHQIIQTHFESNDTLENDIQNKLEDLINDEPVIDGPDAKLNLDANELTIANLDENNYTFEDIQNSLDKENKDTSINQNMTLDEPNSLVLDENFRDFLLNEKNITEFESQFNSNSNENNKKLSVTDLVF